MFTNGKLILDNLSVGVKRLIDIQANIPLDFVPKPTFNVHFGVLRLVAETAYRVNRAWILIVEDGKGGLRVKYHNRAIQKTRLDFPILELAKAGIHRLPIWGACRCGEK